MVFKTTPLEALDDLLNGDIKYFKKNPEVLKILLASGFEGYENITLGELAKYYLEAFPKKTNGHIQLLDPANPKIVLAEYKMYTKPSFRIIKGGKKKKIKKSPT